MGRPNLPKRHEQGLLPPAIGPRSLAAQRAATLRERRFPCDVITCPPTLPHEPADSRAAILKATAGPAFPIGT